MRTSRSVSKLEMAAHKPNSKAGTVAVDKSKEMGIVRDDDDDEAELHILGCRLT